MTNTFGTSPDWRGRYYATVEEAILGTNKYFYVNLLFLLTLFQASSKPFSPSERKQDLHLLFFYGIQLKFREFKNFFLRFSIKKFKIYFRSHKLS